MRAALNVLFTNPSSTVLSKTLSDAFVIMFTLPVIICLCHVLSSVKAGNDISSDMLRRV